tara:strand:+ start:827 stop:1186 length:360 start_codon:yes stop_codon:yes gene_type:complete
VIHKGNLEKLKCKTQIDLVFKKGRAVRSGALVMHFVHPKEEVKKTHIGVGISKKSVLQAYRRNRIKRQIRAIIQKQKEKVIRSLSPGFYMVLYKGRLGVASESLLRDFEGLLNHFTDYN